MKCPKTSDRHISGGGRLIIARSPVAKPTQLGQRFSDLAAIFDKQASINEQGSSRKQSQPSDEIVGVRQLRVCGPLSAADAEIGGAPVLVPTGMTYNDPHGAVWPCRWAAMIF